MNSGKTEKPAERVETSPAATDRRDFLTNVSTVAMAGGLVAGYGTFAVMAGQYIFPAEVETPWLFVAEVSAVQPGGSLDFASPTGVRVAIARRPDQAPDQAAEVGDFIALSSVCPHLGCRVHWEAQNRRFFCPCHNGVFDPEGKPVSGPPLAAGQELSRYPLKIERGLLYIAMSTETVGGTARQASRRVTREQVAECRNRLPEGLA